MTVTVTISGINKHVYVHFNVLRYLGLSRRGREGDGNKDESE